MYPGLRLMLYFLFLYAAFPCQIIGQTGGKVIAVNDVGDSFDASPGDGICADAAGKCTLRAAIAESNAIAGTDAIVFDVSVPAVINLTLGELLTTDPVGIFGRGARNLTIQRSSEPGVPNFRVFNLQAPSELGGLTIRNGVASMEGGGVLANAHTRIFDVAITGNHGGSGGGIAFLGPSGTSIVERCLINSNTADGRGGGAIYSAYGEAYPLIKSSTITNNSASTAGALLNDGPIVFVNDTVTNNSADLVPSSIKSGYVVEIINTILGPGAAPRMQAFQGSFLSLGSNVVTNSTGSFGWREDDQVSTNNSIDPLLADLANNGGQTDTMAPLPGSPTIERGNNCVLDVHCDNLPFAPEYQTLRDQRKFVREAGSHVDVGALEVGSNLITGIYTWSVFFGQTQRLAYSRVTVTNTETLERRETFISLLGGTRPLDFVSDVVYLAEAHTKRAVMNNPLVIGD